MISYSVYLENHLSHFGITSYFIRCVRKRWIFFSGCGVCTCKTVLFVLNCILRMVWNICMESYAQIVVNMKYTFFDHFESNFSSHIEHQWVMWRILKSLFLPLRKQTGCSTLLLLRQYEAWNDYLQTLLRAEKRIFKNMFLGLKNNWIYILIHS